MYIKILFSFTITEWNKLGCDIRNSDSLNVFKLPLLEFAGLLANSVFEINNLQGLKIANKIAFRFESFALS